MYDYLCTISMEINSSWSRRVTGTNILFLINRHAFLVFIVTYLVFQTPGSATDNVYVTTTI